MKKFGYVDGFVLPIPRKNVAKYKKLAKKFGKLWMKYGAIEYVECIADDVKPGKVTSFPQAVKLKKGEVVFFSYITYKNRAHRNKVFKQVMNDPAMADMSPDSMPFDGMRMFWGGFKTAVKL